MAKSHYSCAVIGDWHLAFNVAACIASLGHKTILVNPLSNKNSTPWAEFPQLQLNEPGLPELIQYCREQGALSFGNGVTSEWSADFIWLAIDTPVNERDEVDLQPLLEVVELSRKFQNPRSPFVISSQIPVGFCKQIEDSFGLTPVYVPENLRLGKGIETFKFADRTVIGSNSKTAREAVRKFLEGFQTEFLLCDAVTAEMIKHATNAFLATSISFANEIARIGELMGADNILVGQALRLDKRIGKNAYVIPGLGFAGGTLPRDLRILQKLGRERQTPTHLTDAVLTINESTAAALIQSVTHYLESLKNKNILIMGYTYKADTDTLRRSPSVDLANGLKSGGAKIHGFDPMMNKRDLTSIEYLIQHHDDWEKISHSMDAIVVMTGRKEFTQVDWSKMNKMNKSQSWENFGKACLVLDTQNMISSAAVLDAGLAYKGMWRPAIQPY